MEQFKILFTVTDSRIQQYCHLGYFNTKILGFKRVNLIGGKNNAGKTAFLEALLLHNFPRPKSIIELKKIRRESSEISKSRPERTWDNFFLDQKYQEKIKIIGKYSEDLKTVEIYVSDTINSDFLH